MDLALSDDQRQLQLLVREYCRDRLADPGSAVGSPHSDAGWRALGALGVFDLASAADPGAGIVEQVIVAEQLGRTLGCGQYAATVCFVAPILGLGGDELYAAVTQGASTVAFGHSGLGIDFEDSLLSGEWRLVGGFDATDCYLLAEEAGPSMRIWVVAAAHDAVHAEVRQDLDLAATTVDLRLAEAPARLVATVSSDQIGRLESRARLVLAAELVGLTDAAISLAADYAKVRTTFGHPIGSYQAVSHPLADSVAKLEGLRSLVYWTACHIEADSAEASQLADAAKVRAGEVAMEATSRALHTFGGIGLTWEHVIHRYYRRAIVANATGGTGFALGPLLGAKVMSSLAVEDTLR